jgi:hypothetical protein
VESALKACSKSSSFKKSFFSVHASLSKGGTQEAVQMSNSYRIEVSVFKILLCASAKHRFKDIFQIVFF